mmetsp:Transcript_31264/g.70231  ORF Transcript_31264/g.70231 Transcript_31264/m.70231 type:complete len:87 (-) Transcript_31264:381-641(-)
MDCLLFAYVPARTITEACRPNSKKEKRVRNKENMRKFRKPKPTRWQKGPQVGSSAATKRAAAKALEADFMGKLFIHVVDDEADEKA